MIKRFNNYVNTQHLQQVYYVNQFSWNILAVEVKVDIGLTDDFKVCNKKSEKEDREDDVNTSYPCSLMFMFRGFEGIVWWWFNK